MNSATAGTPVTQKNSHNQNVMFRTQGVVSFAHLPAMLADLGLTLNRVHQKPAASGKDAQIMFVFERGEQLIDAEKEVAINRIFFGEETGAGFAFSATARLNTAIAATSELHKGVPEHVLISCTGATRRIGTEQDLRLNQRQRDVIAAMPQVRVSLNLSSDVAESIPDWVEKRSR